MAHQVEVCASAVKEILSLPQKLAERVRTAIDALAEQPRPFGSIKLEGFKNLYRIRISDIRIVYSIDDTIKIVEIIEVSAIDAKFIRSDNLKNFGLPFF